MSKPIAPLTDRQVRNAAPVERLQRLFDGGGLYIEITSSGNKVWWLKYRRPNGGETRISFGRYPDVTLAEARQKRDEARKLLASGQDPVEAKRAAKAAYGAPLNTFETVARDWHAATLDQWQPGTAANILHRFEVDIFPALEKRHINDLTAADLLAVLSRIEQRGAREVAKRMAADVSRVFVHAMHCGIIDRNPAATLGKVLKPPAKGHFAAIDADELPAFLATFASNNACMGPIVRIAMHLMLLLFVRTSELIETPWSEIDVEGGEFNWKVIPWQRMKRGKRRVNPDTNDHQVCPPRQARLLLKELHSYTGGGTLLFPNMRQPELPMSNNTLLKALERMGYKGDMTGHGFRALAMGTLKERLRYRHEVVDRQLAHAQKNKLDSATFCEASNPG
ncbi:MAG: integrase arm-type DNA-binding domain-containing protein [Duganella sp.]